MCPFTGDSLPSEETDIFYRLQYPPLYYIEPLMSRANQIVRIKVLCFIYSRKVSEFE